MKKLFYTAQCHRRLDGFDFVKQILRPVFGTYFYNVQGNELFKRFQYIFFGKYCAFFETEFIS